jgi:hypothetical protein
MEVREAGAASSDLKLETQIGTTLRLAEWFLGEGETEPLRKAMVLLDLREKAKGPFAGCKNAVEIHKVGPNSGKCSQVRGELRGCVRGYERSAN